MAGKRHHIIPRFLQKGFASRIDGETVWTWQYRKGKTAPSEISTKDILVSKHFYGKGVVNADDVITELEQTKLSPLIESLRFEDLDLKSRTKDIAILIAHLSIRSKLIRTGFEEMSNRFLGGMKDMFGDKDTVSAILDSAPRSFIEDQFETVLKNPNIPEIEAAIKVFEAFGMSEEEVKSFITDLVQNQLKSPETREENINLATDLLRTILEPPETIIRDSIKEGHIKSLLANLAPDARVHVFEDFTWRVHKIDFGLILGDSPCLFLRENNDRFVPHCEPKSARTVLLPISYSQMLIGTAAPDSKVYVDAGINETVASCSLEQFIANDSAPELIALIDLIGTNANLADDAELDAEINQIRQNLGEMIYGDGDSGNASVDDDAGQRES